MEYTDNAARRALTAAQEADMLYLRAETEEDRACALAKVRRATSRLHANELLEVLGLQGIGASPERLTVKKRVKANIGDVLLDDSPFDFIVGLTGRTWLETLTATERAEYEQAEYRRKLAEYNARVARRA